jgi:hypothetical protein
MFPLVAVRFACPRDIRALGTSGATGPTIYDGEGAGTRSGRERSNQIVPAFAPIVAGEKGAAASERGVI